MERGIGMVKNGEERGYQRDVFVSVSVHVSYVLGLTE
jgi:hypothetical protein